MFIKKIEHLFEFFCYTGDFFKSPLSFNYSEKQHLVSTKFGTLLSLLILSYLISIFFNSNMYLKTNPTVLTQMLYYKYSPEIKLDKTNFEIAVGIFDPNMINYEIDPLMFEIKIFQIYKFNHQNNTYFINKELKPFHNCTNADFPLTSLPLLYKYLVCLDNFSLDLKGNVIEPNISYFTLELHICNNLTNTYHCKSMDVIENFINGKMFGIQFSDYNINFNDFENPLIATHQNHILWIDVRSSKIMEIHLRKLEFIDDNNYIGSNLNKTEQYTTDTFSSDFTTVESIDPDTPLAYYYFFANQNIQESKRTYQKLTDLLANIGGTASLLVSIGFLFINLFNNWEMRVKFFANLYDLNKNNNDNNFHSKKVKTSNEIITKKENVNIDIEISQTNNHSIMISRKHESKVLKEDSFVLEQYSVEKLEKNYKKKKKISLNFIWYFIFRIKRFFGIKFNESENTINFIDEGIK